jgi:DNA-binding CsgD family transcriptional regulator
MVGSAEADEAAILRLIETETAAYFNKDYEAWARCWVHAPYARRYGWYERGGRVVRLGWEEEAAEMRAAMERYAAPNRSVDMVHRENVSIRVGGDMAWATFEQVAPKTGDPFDVPGRQYEARVLERHEGDWKIACCFVLGSPTEFVQAPLICVDDQSRVLWMNGAARDEIGKHRTLMLAAGRLRARSRNSDRSLQAAIGWAAGIKGYVAHQVAARAPQTRGGILPLILGDGDEAGADICWVSAESGMILVSFNDSHANDLSLDAAQVVYGISDAQRRLAGLLLAGHDLASAANELGVSINTARTQLNRMFDKTGVRSQPALVRALLGTASPLG